MVDANEKESRSIRLRGLSECQREEEGEGEWRDGHREDRDGKKKLRQRSEKDDVTGGGKQAATISADRSIPERRG